MGIKLYPHQVDALKKMKNGCILCGGVGSGKSITSLAYYYLQQGGDPNSLIDGEYFPMGDPPKDLYIITTARKRDTLEWDGELTPFLMSRDERVSLYKNKVVIDSWNNIKKYANVYGAFFIFDEQKVIGSGAWVKAFLKIVKKNKWVILSATPGDTWQDYIPVFIANGFYKNRGNFSSNHIVYNRFTSYPKIDKYINTGELIRHRNEILVTMNFKRETVSHYEDIYTQYDFRKYKQVNAERWNPYNNEPIINATQLCYILRKVINSDESRQLAVLELFEKHPKVIIFYNFNYELDILKNLAYGPNVNVAEWNGRAHDPLPKSKSWVYLVQYAAGCEGWNCIETNAIIFYSQNYSYKMMVQAAGRIDRLNTKFYDLYYYNLQSKAPIDLAIKKALKEKKSFNANNYTKW